MAFQAEIFAEENDRMGKAEESGEIHLRCYCRRFR